MKHTVAEETSDSDLLTHARRRDQEAVAELYARHRAAARRLATTYRRAGDPDDLVNEAFFRVFGALERGSGPDDSFRAYLFVTLRRTAMEIIGSTRDEPVADIPEPVMAEARAPVLDVADRQMVLAAYGSLSGREQSVLWQTAVEGRRPRELAPVLGLSANAVSAAASRARNQLREAYLQAHVATAPRPECEPHRSRLGAFVREGLGRDEHTDTQTHVNECESCRGLVAELTDVNTMLVRSLVPIFAGMSKAGVLVAGGAGGAAAVAGKAGPAGGALTTARRLFTKLRSNPGAGAGAAAATVMVAAGLTAALVSSGGADEPPPRETEAEAPTDGEDGGSFPPTSAVVDRPAEPPPADPETTPAPAPPPAEPDTAPAAPPASTTTTSTTTTPVEPPSPAPAPSSPPTSPPTSPPVPDPIDVPSTTAPSSPPTTQPLPGSHATPPSTIPPSRPTPPPSTVPPARPGPPWIEVEVSAVVGPIELEIRASLSYPGDVAVGHDNPDGRPEPRE